MRSKPADVIVSQVQKTFRAIDVGDGSDGRWGAHQRTLSPQVETWLTDDEVNLVRGRLVVGMVTARNAGQGSAQAVVNAVAECDVAVGVAAEVEGEVPMTSYSTAPPWNPAPTSSCLTDASSPAPRVKHLIGG